MLNIDSSKFVRQFKYYCLPSQRNFLKNLASQLVDKCENVHTKITASQVYFFVQNLTLFLVWKSVVFSYICMDYYIYIYIYIYIYVKKNFSFFVEKGIGSQRDLYFLKNYLFCSYICVCFQLVAFIREHLVIY